MNLLTKLASDRANLAPLYFVECDYGKRGQEFWPTQRNTSSRAQVVADILKGEIGGVIKVLEVFEDEGTCRDITEDVALEVLRQAEVEAGEDEDDALTFGVAHYFLEEQLGFERVQRAIAEAVS